MACRRLLLLFVALVVKCSFSLGEIHASNSESNWLDMAGISDDDIDTMIEDSKKQVESENKALSEDELNDIQTSHGRQADQREVKKMAVAEKTLELVTDKLARKLGLTSGSEDMVRLSDVKQKLLKRLVCPIAPVNCNTSSKYRTVDGTCNNLQNTLWGKSFTPYKRLLPADYADGQSRAWELRNNIELPNPRRLSTTIFKNKKNRDSEKSDFSMLWGQFLAHDILHSQQPKPNCLFSCFDQRSESCFGIKIPCNDAHLPGGSCIPLKRDTGLPLGCTGGTKEQLNGLTAYIDGSGVYGDTQSQSDKVRAQNHEGCGLLKMVPNPYGSNYKDLLPTSNTGYCRSRHGHKCYVSGDGLRTNENAALSTLHIIFAREHNRLVKELRRINPSWDCERLYQEARKIVGAILQIITYKEYLPTILNQYTILKYKLQLGVYTGYNSNVNPGIANSFSTATFRFGHSQIREVIDRYARCSYRNRWRPHRWGWGGKPYGGSRWWHNYIHSWTNCLRKVTPINMDRFFDPDATLDYVNDGCDSILRGMAFKPAEQVDGNFASAVQHKLQTAPGGKGDLPAINTQRSRDHGLPAYNKFRQLCGLKVAKTFEDFKNEITDAATRASLKELYGHPDNVELFPGGILEAHVQGASMGPTFSCLMGKQFQALREGDRFWFENTNGPQSFTPEQLLELKKVSLAKIICNNGDNIKKLQRFVQLNAKPGNERRWCRDHPDIDLTKWRML